MSRFEKVDGYNAIQDNQNEIYTLCEYEPRAYYVDEFDVDDLLNLLNSMDNKIHELKNQIAYMQSKIEEGE